MTRAVLSIGSNLGDRLGALRGAVAEFDRFLLAVSSVYETAPWGPIEQPDYLNAVLIVEDPAATPTDWLSRAQGAEQRAGRVRETRWGPRSLDVDVIEVDGIISADPVLTLPHPRAAERAFVLLPWAEIDARPTLRALIAALSVEDQRAVRKCEEWTLR